jgi:hypothetical protein
VSTVYRKNRKGSDEQILRLNSVGFSLGTIAAIIDCHPSSITLRLKSLGVAPTDTRHAFMESIYNTLPTDFQEEIADILAEHDPSKPRAVKDYVRELIINDIKRRRLESTNG